MVIFGTKCWDFVGSTLLLADGISQMLGLCMLGPFAMPFYHLKALKTIASRPHIQYKSRRNQKAD